MAIHSRKKYVGYAIKPNHVCLVQQAPTRMSLSVRRAIIRALS